MTNPFDAAVSGRREFIRGLSAGASALVLGFSPEARAWCTDKHTNRGAFRALPRLDGELVLDEASTAAVSADLGLLEVQTPVAVLRPGSVEDVVRMVKFCNKHDIAVAARGQGHATNGQALVEAGLIIDLRTLNRILEVGEGYAVVEGGTTWRAVLEQTLLTSQTPPVLTGYIGLSVGGTLSMGGFNGMSYRHGAQVDHALELSVVTGEGKLVHCSETCDSQLFLAVLAGIGQYGIIVGAKLRLVPAKERAIEWNSPYSDTKVFFKDMRKLVARAEIDLIRASVVFDPITNAPVYSLNTIQYYDAATPPDFERLHRGLHIAPGSTVSTDRTYYDFTIVLDNVVDFLRSIGQFEGQMHPWFDVFVPDPESESFISGTIAALTAEDVGTFGQVLLFPVVPAAIKRPLLRLPEGELVFLFDLLTQANFPGFDATYAERMQSRNRELFERAKAIGGKRYPIGTLDFDKHDWRKHYGSLWGKAQSAKNRFDPKNLLTPGPKIF